MEDLTALEAAKILKVPIAKLSILEEQGILHRTKNEGQTIFYSQKEIARIRLHKELSIADLAAYYNSEIQNKTISSVSAFRKIFIIIGGCILGYFILLVIFAWLFMLNPLQTAAWLGIAKTKVPAALTQGKSDSQVLGATTVVQPENASPLQVFLQPVGRASLGIVKNINPESYAQIARVAILDPNDVLSLDSGDAMTPVVPLKVSNSSLEVTNSGLIPNLNSQFLEGKKPGTHVGDIAIVGVNSGIENLSPPPLSQPVTKFDLRTLTGLTNSNLSGSAGITNTNLANAAVTIATANPLSGGGTVSLGGTLTLDCPTCGDVVDLTTKVTNVLPLTNGGMGATSFIPNGLLYGNGTNAIQALTPGTSGYVLQSNGTSAAPSWEAISGLSASTVPFSGITTGTNTSATMTIGTGGILQYSGTGVLNANQLLSNTWASPGSIGSTTANTGNFTTLTSTTLNGLTVSNNGSNTLTIATGKTLTASNSLTFSGTDGTSFIFPAISDDLVGLTATQTLTNKTLAAGANTITGLTASNLTAGDFSSKINAGLYSINISGNAATTTNFSGSLLGDVTGTQTTTSVDKIKGAVLGTTTATSGNVLIGNGTQWVTQALSNDATINSSGALTLKNTGAAGTYGSVLNIPVLTTDAQGRVTGVTNTTIAGLTTSNFSSANISQWTNNSGFITPSSSDVLTNKTIAEGSNTISGLTNSNLSGTAGISNANLANSSLSISTSGPLGGGGSVSLGGALTVTCATCLTTGGTLFTAAATSGSNSSISQGGTLTLTAGSNMTTTNNGTGGITFATSANPTFTTVNGLTITNNGSNTLSIAAGKTLSANNSLALAGVDGTTITFQGTDTYVGRSTTDTLTNKTLAAGSNTISGLTNANLSGTAGIINANLANSSLTVTAGTGLSGGGAVSLGSSVTLNNAGVLSLNSTQATVSASTGNITISLPQNIDTSANPTFSSLQLLNTSNQLTFGNTGVFTWTPTTLRTLTLPDATDTLVGKATIDVLTNKTLTSPVLNGTITTSGLTLPAFTASGNIIGSGSPTISSFGAINGLTFTSASDGFTVAGGTTSRTLTVTGADITIGNTIKPSSSGGLTVQSNGANGLTLDAGGASAVNLGTTNATSLSLGNSSAATAITGNKWSVTSAGAATFSPTASSITALTVNGTTNTTPADALDLNLLHTGGTATNGLVVTMNGSGGTTTNGVNITQSAGTLSNGLSLGGTIANALNFVGTNFTKLINSTNFNITNTGVVTGGTYNGITIGSTIQPSASGAIALQSNGANTVTVDTGSSGSTINLGNTNAAAIALGNGTQNTTLTLSGTGLTTLGGNLTFSGSAARTITGPNTGAAGALTLTTTGNISGLALNTANATSGNSGVLSLTTGTVTTSGTSGNVTINTGSSNTATLNTGGITVQSGNITTSGTSGNVALEIGTGGTLGTIQLGVASNAPITTGTGLTTIGGNITFSGSSARTITGPNTGAAGALTLTTTGNLSGLTFNTANASSGNSGAITLQSGNTSISGTSGGITIDTGSGASANGTITLGTTNASAVTIGRSSVTTTINGLAAANTLTVGGGTTILKHLSATNTFDAAGVTLGSCSDIGTVTVTGAAVGDSVTASPTAVSGGIETLLLIWNAYVSSANTVTIRACSVATLGTQNPANQTWRADVWQH